METSSVMAVLSATDKNFTSTMENASKTMNSLDESSHKTQSTILKFAKAAGIFKVVDAAVAALSGSVDGAIKRFDTMNSFPRVMEQIGFSTEQSEKSVNKLADGIEGLPTSLDAITGSTQKIALLTGDLEKATDTSIALNNAFLASGSATADAERGLVQYTQMLSKGEVDLVSWRTLQETMGVALNEVAGAFGFAGDAAQNDLYAALKSGEITFDQFNAKIIEMDNGVNGFAERAKTSSAGIGTSFQNLQTSLVKGVTTIISATDQMLQDNGFGTIAENIDNAKGIINTASAAIADNIGTIGSTIINLAPVLKTGATAWIAYEGAMKISEAATKTVDKVKKAKEAFLQTQKATELATKATNAKSLADKTGAIATTASAKAAKASALAESLNSKFVLASAKASKAKASADGLAVKAAKAKAAAEKAGYKDTALNLKMTTAATAATNAKTNADNLAAIAIQKKAEANRASAMAETLDTTATTANSVAESTSTAATIANTAAEEANADAIKTNSALIAFKTTLMGALSSGNNLATSTTLAWNAALEANSISMVITGVVGLITVIGIVGKALSNLDSDFKNFISTQEEAINSVSEGITKVEEAIQAYKEDSESIKTNAKANKKLAQEIEKLITSEDDSIENKQLIKSKVESLNASLEGLNAVYDEETNSLDTGNASLSDRVSAYKEVQEAQLAESDRVSLLESQIEAEEKLASATQTRAEIEKEMNENAATMGMPQMKEYKKLLGEAIAEEERAKTAKEELSTIQGELDTAIIEGQAAQATAVSEGTQSQILSLEDLDQSTQSVIESLNSTWQSYIDHSTNMFDTLSDKQEMSVQDMIENLTENQRVMGDWADNIAILASKGIDDGLLAKMKEMGPEGAGYVAAMVDASDEELAVLSEKFAAGGTTATDSLKTAWDFEGSGISQSVTDLATQAGDTLSSSMAEIDWASIGQNSVAGMVDGFSESKDDAKASGEEVGEAVKDGTTSTLGIHSPSTVYREYGVNTVQGYVLGILSQQGPLNSAMESVMASAARMAERTMNTSMSNFTASAAGFKKVPQIAKVSMSATASAILSGMAASNREMSSGMVSMVTVTNIGMRTISLTVTTGMRTITVTTTSGMSSFVRALTSGMNQSVSATKSGAAMIISSLSVLQSGFYSSGRYASLGLARGINDGARAAISAANSLARRVAATMESALDINSPSRVTRKLGVFTGVGLGLGILDEIAYVERASERLANAAVPGNIANRLAYSAVGNYATQALSNYAGEMRDTTYTIVVPVELEGREVARVIAPFSQEEMDKYQRRNNRSAGIR